MNVVLLRKNSVFTGSPEGADKSSNDSKGDECGGDWVEAAAAAEAVECYNYY